MKIGFFGGSFDPPHRGHLHVARAAVERFGLERVLLAPTGRQPFKPQGLHASFADRLEMVRLLVEDQSHIVSSDIDGPNAYGSPNFTVTALQRLHSTIAAEDAVYMLVGIDAFLGVTHWREPNALFELAEWIVVSRPGFDMDSIDQIGLSAQQRMKVHMLDTVAEDVSSTELRSLLANGEDVSGLIPRPVLEYIRARGLYCA